jgi:hypothetical protein
MIGNRVLVPAGPSGTQPNGAPLARPLGAVIDESAGEATLKATPSPSPRANGALGAMADAGGEAMRSMAMDPVWATRQTFGMVRRHPYITAMVLLLFGAAIAGLSRS